MIGFVLRYLPINSRCNGNAANYALPQDKTLSRNTARLIFHPEEQKIIAPLWQNISEGPRSASGLRDPRKRERTTVLFWSDSNTKQSAKGLWGGRRWFEDCWTRCQSVRGTTEARRALANTEEELIGERIRRWRRGQENRICKAAVWVRVKAEH